MLEVSRLLTDNRLWMKDRDELALDLAFYTNIAEGTLLDMKGRANPWDWLHSPGQPYLRGNHSAGSPSDGSAILAEGVRIKRHDSDPSSGKSGPWLDDFVKAQQAGKMHYFDQCLLIAGRVENWKESVFPIPPMGPFTPPRSVDTGISGGRSRSRSPLANHESSVGVIQSIEEDYTMGSQNRQASANRQSLSHDRNEISPGDLEDEPTRCLRSCTPFEKGIVGSSYASSI